MRRTLRIAALMVGLAGLVAPAGCLFEPREAEPPASGTTVVYFDKTSSANVWANLEKSLEAVHAPGWEDNISQNTFIYIPDTDAEAQFPGVFNGWNRDKEVAFINSFYNSDVTITAQMKDADFNAPPDTGAEVEWENVIYDITVTSNVDQSTTRYRGSAIITFRLEGSFWYVYQWRDQQGESDPGTGQLLPTMGVLRGTFASN
ncbi:hypothetical protein KDM41_16310 [bacterium]|nr:hypothetical protein [bacterium]